MLVSNHAPEKGRLEALRLCEKSGAEILSRKPLVEPRLERQWLMKCFGGTRQDDFLVDHVVPMFPCLIYTGMWWGCHEVYL